MDEIVLRNIKEYKKYCEILKNIMKRMTALLQGLGDKEQRKELPESL